MVGTDRIWRFCSIYKTNYLEHLICVLCIISSRLLLPWPHTCAAQCKWESKSKKYNVFSKLLGTWCLNVAGRPFLLFDFCLNWAIHFLNFKYSSIIIPRYLVWCLGITFGPLRQKLRCLVICFEYKYFSFANI